MLGTNRITIQNSKQKKNQKLQHTTLAIYNWISHSRGRYLSIGPTVLPSTQRTHPKKKRTVLPPILRIERYRERLCWGTELNSIWFDFYTSTVYRSISKFLPIKSTKGMCGVCSYFLRLLNSSPAINRSHHHWCSSFFS